MQKINSFQRKFVLRSPLFWGVETLNLVNNRCGFTIPNSSRWVHVETILTSGAQNSNRKDAQNCMCRPFGGCSILELHPKQYSICKTNQSKGMQQNFFFFAKFDVSSQNQTTRLLGTEKHDVFDPVRANCCWRPSDVMIGKMKVTWHLLSRSPSKLS